MVVSEEGSLRVSQRQTNRPVHRPVRAGEISKLLGIWLSAAVMHIPQAQATSAGLPSEFKVV